MGSSQAANDLKEQLSGKVSTVVLHGLEALIEVSQCGDVDTLMAAIVGAAKNQP